MKKFSEFEIEGRDKKMIKAFKLEAKNPIAIVHIIHGLSEHSGRYIEFANFLISKKISVYMLDNRGHGKNLKREDYSDFTLIDKYDMKEILYDHKELSEIINKKNKKKIPSILLGHSFGSFVAQKYIQEFNDKDMVFLSGSICYLRIIRFLFFWSKFIYLFSPREANSANLTNKIFFLRKRNKMGKNSVEVNQWLTRDQEKILSYSNDPLCNQWVKLIWWKEMYRFLLKKNLFKKKLVDKIDKKLEIVIFSGKEDILSGRKGKRLELLKKMYEKSGIQNVELMLYDEGKHEMLNEINRDEVFEYIYQNIGRIIK